MRLLLSDGDTGQKIRGRSVKGIGEGKEPGGGDSVRSRLIFLDLLETQATASGERLLRKPEASAPRSQRIADHDIERMGSSGLVWVLELQRIGRSWDSRSGCCHDFSPELMHLMRDIS